MPSSDRLPATADHRPAGASVLTDLLGGDSARSQRFLRGLVAGALAGAAIAGTLAARRRSKEPPAR